jgi:hypothetical protein
MNSELFAMYAVGKTVMKQVEHALSLHDAVKPDDDLSDVMHAVSPDFDISCFPMGLARHINEWVINDEEMARVLVQAIDEIKSTPLFEVEEVEAA